MLALSFVTALAAVASAYAACSVGTDTVTSNFKLSAYNAATGTTTPLNLLVAYVETETAYHVLSTGSGQSYGWLGFTLSSGALTATPPNGYTAPAHYIGLDAPPAGGNSIYPTAAPWPLFSNTFAYPSGVFCSVPNPSGGDNILALNGVTNLFALCESSFTSTLPITDALLYNPSSTSLREEPNTYDGSSCVPVTVLLVPS